MRFVKGAGFLVRGLAQVSMNLTDFEQTPVHRVFELVKREAARYGVMPVSSEIVGLIPKKALEQAAEWFLQVENFDSSLILENRLAAVMSGKMAVGRLARRQSSPSSSNSPRPRPRRVAAAPRPPPPPWPPASLPWSPPCRAARRLCTCKLRAATPVLAIARLDAAARRTKGRNRRRRRGSYNAVMKAFKQAKRRNRREQICRGADRGGFEGSDLRSPFGRRESSRDRANRTIARIDDQPQHEIRLDHCPGTGRRSHHRSLGQRRNKPCLAERSGLRRPRAPADGNFVVARPPHRNLKPPTGTSSLPQKNRGSGILWVGVEASNVRFRGQWGDCSWVEPHPFPSRSCCFPQVPCC